MSGVDRITGRMLPDWPHTQQSIVDFLLPTSFGDRIHREDYGSLIPAMILRTNLDRTNAVLLFWAISLAIDLEEPRFDVKRVKPSENVETRREGALPILVVGDFLPRAHLGDFTVALSNVSIEL